MPDIGSIYVFLRSDGAPLPTGCAGHVGWGFELEPGRLMYGSTENQSGKPLVPPGGDNGYWALPGTLDTMRAAMRARNYESFRWAKVRNCNGPNARLAAEATAASGYRALGNNCLDHVWRIADAYGVAGLPWLQTHPSPADWYAVFNGEAVNL